MGKLTYKNGRTESPGEHKRAQEGLVHRGATQLLGNFAPHTARKEDIRHRVVEVFEEGGFQYTVVEYESMSLSMDFQTVSAPRLQRAVWYMPVGQTSAA